MAANRSTPRIRPVPGETGTAAGAGPPAPAWAVYADAALQRAALVARVARDREPDPLAGLKVDDDDLARLLATLPGLDAGSRDGLVGVPTAALDDARQALMETLSGPDAEDDPFARIVFAAAFDGLAAEVFAVLAAVEADPRRQRLVGYLNDDVTQRRLTPFSLQVVIGRPEAVLAVAPGGVLDRAGLLAEHADVAWASLPVGVAHAVSWWLAGHRALDPDLPAGADLLGAPGTGTHGVITVAGPDRVRRLQAAVAHLCCDAVLVVPLPGTPVEWAAVIRQATLAGTGIVFEVEGDTFGPDARDRIDRATHLPVAIASAHDLPLVALPRRAWFAAPVEPPIATRDEWAALLGDTPGGPPLTAEQLRLVAAASKGIEGGAAAAVRRLAAGHIDRHAARIRPSRGWDDIVLDPERLDHLQEVAARSRHRDLVYDEWGFSPFPSAGVVALFSGPSGTGKTLAAEIIAGALGVDLYKVDLASLVSKYIGETEKNLAQIFDAAGASNVVLFFDEADALLGKRSEVSDAHDRYANIEVSYLLQRLERYDGLVVLATNLPKNIDPAFMRRVHISVEFPLPEAAERRRIWEASIPVSAPRGELDLAFLAEGFEISGGAIRNAALAAAFAAAEAGTPITMAALVKGLRRELQKLGRLVHTADFGAYDS